MALKNQGEITQELLDDLEDIGNITQQSSQDLVVAVACAFFSPTYGTVSAKDRDRVVASAEAAAAKGVSLAATTGQEHPREIYEGVLETRERFPELRVGVHLHNRNGCLHRLTR